jgi:NAD(P)-dependent dehydrogenase (short-subunit alcohol dehydrogenase family)
MPGRLAGKIAIITGASRGLGQYCALGYAREGATVVIAARTEEVKDERRPARSTRQRVWWKKPAPKPSP